MFDSLQERLARAKFLIWALDRLRAADVPTYLLTDAIQALTDANWQDLLTLAVKAEPRTTFVNAHGSPILNALGVKELTYLFALTKSVAGAIDGVREIAGASIRNPGSIDLGARAFVLAVERFAATIAPDVVARAKTAAEGGEGVKKCVHADYLVAYTGKDDEFITLCKGCGQFGEQVVMSVQHVPPFGDAHYSQRDLRGAMKRPANVAAVPVITLDALRPPPPDGCPHEDPEDCAICGEGPQ